MMSEKSLAEQTIDELFHNKKKTKRELIRNSVVLFLIVLISIFVTSEKGFSVFTFLPVFCSYSILSSYVRLNKIKSEIESRILHLKIRR